MSQRLIPFGEILQLAPRELVGDRELPIMSITMHEGLIDQDQKFKKRIASRDTSTYKVVHRRKLVVGFPIDEGVLGFQNKYDAAAVSPAYDIWEETGSHQIDLNYFERILRSPFARMIYASKMRGTTNRRRTVPKEIFKQIMFPLPPLEEQKRIAGILDAADSLRAKRRESLAKLDDLLQSTFLDMFGDPVTNPKGWEKVDLGQHAQLINGDRGTNYPSRENFVEKGIPFINAGHLSEGKIDFTKMNFISENRFNLLGSGKIKKHDILYCLRGSLGKSAIVQTEGKGAIASSLVIIRPAEILSVEYLYSYLDSSFGQREIRSFDNGSSQPNLSAANVKKYSFPLPPLDLQQRFAEIVSSVEEQKAKMRKHLEQLDDLFASLQQRAFRGDL